MPAVKRGAGSADAVGTLNGILGGATGLAGVIVTIWCGVRGWPKDVQRTVFQPVGVTVFAMSAAWLGTRGEIDRDTVGLFFLGLPALAAGTWLGLKLFGRLDEFAFRKVVLFLLLDPASLWSLHGGEAAANRYCATLERTRGGACKAYCPGRNQ
jgi:uncharacterized membrane protein YfcA